jgi:hypothetical protein
VGTANTISAEATEREEAADELLASLQAFLSAGI